MTSISVLTERFKSFHTMYRQDVREESFVDWPFREGCNCTPEKVRSPVCCLHQRGSSNSSRGRWRKFGLTNSKTRLCGWQNHPGGPLVKACNSLRHSRSQGPFDCVTWPVQQPPARWRWHHDKVAANTYSAFPASLSGQKDPKEDRCPLRASLVLIPLQLLCFSKFMCCLCGPVSAFLHLLFSLQMARAGFVHCPSENEPDVACCFFCLLELEGWEPDDDPW